MSSFNEEDIDEKENAQEQPTTQVGREIKNETHPQDNRVA
jgi:hypothetical protein